MIVCCGLRITYRFAVDEQIYHQGWAAIKKTLVIKPRQFHYFRMDFISNWRELSSAALKGFFLYNMGFAFYIYPPNHASPSLD